MVDEPRGKYFGGEVAAPVFARIMADALRMHGIRPDADIGIQGSRLWPACHPERTGHETHHDPADSNRSAS